MKTKVPALGGIALAAAIMLFPITGLDFSGKAALATLSLAIIWWIFHVFPDYITALIMAILFTLVSKVPLETVCSAFAGSTWWLLFSAFGLSIGVTKCGILKRISHKMLELFPKTFMGQVIGLTTVGFVSAPFIPSMSAKASILAPLSLSISDSMGYNRRGKQASGLFLAMLTGLRTPGPLFVSASVIGYALRAQYSAEINRQFSMGNWFIAALPWFLITTALTFLPIYFLFSPKKQHSTESAQTPSHETTAFPPLDRNEKVMSVIISATLLLWVTENAHGIPAHVVALMALVSMLITNVVSPEEFCKKMNWESMIFIGFVLGIAAVFHELNINSWIVEQFMPVFSLFSGNDTVFLICVAMITILLRFLIVSEIAFINITFVFLLPLAMNLGINPWIIGMTVYAVISPWFFLYQNPVYMTAYHATNKDMLDQKYAVVFCFIYQILCMLAIVLSVPYWKMLGIFYA